MMSGLFALQSIVRALDTLKSFLKFSSGSSSSSSPRIANQEELEKMEGAMFRIRAYLDDAEKHWNIREESAKLRLKELKDLAYDMEDVVDEYKYEVNRCKVQALEECKLKLGKRSRGEENPTCYLDIDVVPVPIELVGRAKKINERLVEISYFYEHFNLSENDGERRQLHPDFSSSRHTSSLVFQKGIIGRDRDTEKIVDKLLSAEGKNVKCPVSVMAIVGMGGLGKTTLAQLVYNNTRVLQSFDKFAWVYVSENSNDITITQNIISSLISKECKDTTLDVLHRKLVEQIKDKKVLLVFDDVWNDREKDLWESVCKPLWTTRICQVIVTTRSEAVARLVQTMDSYHPGLLSFDESWSLFEQVAFPVQQDLNTTTNLLEIGKKVVEKCKGLPIAVKTLGSMLRCETDQEKWEDILKNELWDLGQSQHQQVLPALELSYKHMPIYLKPCFLALSLFPKDNSLWETDVLQVWKVLDLLHCDGNGEYRNEFHCDRSEAEYKIGQLFLTELVQRSILQFDQYTGRYCLHDLVHDLACFLAGEEFFRLEGDTSIAIPKNVRYISLSSKFTSVEIPTIPCNLRAIIAIGSGPAITNIHQTITNNRKLRVLDLGGCRFETIPDSVGSLKLLRHLSLNGYLGGINIIPGSIFHLYNLQTLQLGFSGSNLANRSLRGIGRLINLRTLPEIHITKCCCSVNIKELRNINKIGALHIIGLNSISCIEDANEAQLQSKKGLRVLWLHFSNGRKDCQCVIQSGPEIIPHDQLLESLQPHRNLSKLIIQDYESHAYPGWLGNSSYSKLTRIVLLNCKTRHIRTLGGLHSLTYLTIENMDSVEHIGQEFFKLQGEDKGFISLTNLEFENMENWSEWSGVDEGDFPCLRTISLKHCPKLWYLPVVPFLSLATLVLTDCASIATVPASPALRELCISECSSLSELPILPSLLELYIEDCDSLSSIGCHSYLSGSQPHHSSRSSVSAVSSLPKLTTLTLVDCWSLSAVGSLPSLTALDIWGNLEDDIQYRLLNKMPSLESLEIRWLEEVTCIALKQRSLPSLRTLCIDHCNELQSIDGLDGLTSLESLKVRDCPELPAQYASTATEIHYKLCWRIHILSKIGSINVSFH